MLLRASTAVRIGPTFVFPTECFKIKMVVLARDSSFLSIPAMPPPHAALGCGLVEVSARFAHPIVVERGLKRTRTNISLARRRSISQTATVLFIWPDKTRLL